MKDQNSKKILPLKGLKVLDFTQAMMGPLASMMLGDMGADVIKVERIAGEAIRYGRPAAMDDIFKEEFEKEQTLDAGMWLGCNRNKRSLAIDVKNERGKEIILKLAKETDVFMQNFRPGVIDRLGLSYDVISGLNPKVVYCSIFGFGEKGPLARKVGGDIWSQAMGGVINQIGSPGSPPSMVPFLMVDHGGAFLVAYSVMLALFTRERTGIGQELAVNQLDAVMTLQTTEMSDFLIEGVSRGRMGRGKPLFGPFKCKDGDVISMIGVGPTWPTFCKLLGVEHLAKDSRFETEENREANLEELYPLLDEAFSKKTRAEWQQFFKGTKLRCDPCLTYEELFTHPQVEANEMVATFQHPARGPLKMLGVPVKLKKTAAVADAAPPLLGQHTKEILSDLEYSPEEIDELRELEIIKTAAN